MIRKEKVAAGPPENSEGTLILVCAMRQQVSAVSALKLEKGKRNCLVPLEIL